MATYGITGRLAVPGLANSRFADLSRKESAAGGRIIGGDQGDLAFAGYTLDREKNETVLDAPVLHTSHEDLNEEEVFDIASQVLKESFDSIGMDALEHS